jgi:ribonuclease P protein subunit RPR2
MSTAFENIMAKGGKSSTGNGISQKHLHSRISYLYQAAVYLDNAERERKWRIQQPVQNGSERQQTSLNDAQRSILGSQRNALEAAAERPLQSHTPADVSNTEIPDNHPRIQVESAPLRDFSAQTHHLLTALRSISQKSQIRLSRAIKRSVCRRCNALLALNSTAKVENLSRGGRKPWADVLVVRCCSCGDLKRYPVGMGEEGKRRGRRGRHGAAAGLHEGAGDVEHHHRS